MLNYLITFLLLMHGLAHVTGLLGLWTSSAQAFADAPWIFPGGITSRSAVGRAWGLLWLAAAIGLVGAQLGLLSAQPWWPSLAVAAAGVSLVAIVPCLRVVLPGAWGGALLDLLFVVVLLSPWAERVVKALP